MKNLIDKKTALATRSEHRGSVLPHEGFVRLAGIVGPGGPIPVSKSTWWAGVKTGRFPAPVKLGRGITVWRVEDIRELIERTG